MILIRIRVDMSAEMNNIFRTSGVHNDILCSIHGNIVISIVYAF